MGKGVTRAVGFGMLVIAVPILVGGLSALLYAIAFNYPCVPDAPICRSSWPTGFLLAAVVIGVGIAHAAIGVGIVRGNRIAQVGGLAICIGAFLYAAYLGQAAFTPPTSNNNLVASIAIALAYGVGAVVLLVSIIRGGRPAEPAGIATRHTD